MKIVAYYTTSEGKLTASVNIYILCSSLTIFCTSLGGLDCIRYTDTKLWYWQKHTCVTTHNNYAVAGIASIKNVAFNPIYILLVTDTYIELMIRKGFLN